jgi:hypothetical protein
VAEARGQFENPEEDEEKGPLLETVTRSGENRTD